MRDPSERVFIEFVVLDKIATRFNEAAWLSFESVGEWRMRKLGSYVGFNEVVRGGNPHLHAVDSVEVMRTEDVIEIQSLDAPVISAFNGSRPPTVLMDRQMEQMTGTTGVAFNLWNNAWSTNYLFYYPYHDKDKDFSFEFMIEWAAISGKDVPADFTTYI
eukprot:gnl/MRDRNA2_/MRDRNA2_74805_c0_seq1.p1 gnl/MRDRNA2_/MRDRNA2_74805_c0~~gnl/MRDRNA2_/MRDRNA2_74805_c0_seq1.p1  ORF type:complete len:160 (+),score=33.17 gnl/MRDRNA2_/MRDRNA2_74805_c0_seq1:76-555(+)